MRPSPKRRKAVPGPVRTVTILSVTLMILGFPLVSQASHLQSAGILLPAVDAHEEGSPGLEKDTGGEGYKVWRSIWELNHHIRWIAPPLLALVILWPVLPDDKIMIPPIPPMTRSTSTDAETSEEQSSGLGDAGGDLIQGPKDDIAYPPIPPMTRSTSTDAETSSNDGSPSETETSEEQGASSDSLKSGSEQSSFADAGRDLIQGPELPIVRIQ